jgi:uncharacterized membrane protein YbaN (DUF454 family)
MIKDPQIRMSVAVLGLIAIGFGVVGILKNSVAFFALAMLFYHLQKDLADSAQKTEST